MIIRFSDWFVNKGSGVLKVAQETGKVCFLVSLVDAKTEMGDCVMPSFANTNEFGERIKNFVGSYEMWFAAEVAEKLVTRITEESKQGTMLCFEFVPALIRLEGIPVQGKGDNAHKWYQTISLNDDRYAEPRHMFSKPQPSIAGL